MAVLIVDPDELARETIRRMLSHSGFATLSAKDPEEALLQIRGNSGRLQHILCALETPSGDGLTLVKQVEADPQLFSVPFILLIAGDGPGRARRTLLRQYPRLDAVLLKPFAGSALLAGLAEAFQLRSEKRRTVVYWGNDSSFVSELRLALNRQSYWRQVEVVSGWDDFMTRFPYGARVGALLVSHDSGINGPKTVEGKKLGSFQKTIWGRRFTIAALSPRAEDLLWLRGNAHLFLEMPKGSVATGEMFKQLERRDSSSWERERLLQRKKIPSPSSVSDSGVLAAFAQHLKPSFKAQCKKLLRRDPACFEAHCILAEIDEGRGDFIRARKHYERSLATNPYYPRPYLRLFAMLEAEGKRIEATEIARRAASFCPSHPQIQSRLAGLHLSDQ